MCLAAALGAFVVGGDVYAGANAGENAAEYNSLGVVRKGWKLARYLIEKRGNANIQQAANLILSAEDI